jgi:hypothetical protein
MSPLTLRTMIFWYKYVKVQDWMSSSAGSLKCDGSLKVHPSEAGISCSGCVYSLHSHWVSGAGSWLYLEALCRSVMLVLTYQTTHNTTVWNLIHLYHVDGSTSIHIKLSVFTTYTRYTKINSWTLIRELLRKLHSWNMLTSDNLLLW